MNEWDYGHWVKPIIECHLVPIVFAEEEDSPINERQDAPVTSGNVKLTIGY